MRSPPYVELHAHSAFSFLDGASAPEEMAEAAARMGHCALALTDHDGLCESLAFAHAARAVGVRPITGAEITLDDGSHHTQLQSRRRTRTPRSGGQSPFLPQRPAMNFCCSASSVISLVPLPMRT